jgi:hypothetical protein
MARDRDNYVYIAEADPKAVATAVRRRYIAFFVYLVVTLGVMCLTAGIVVVLARLDGHVPPLFDFLERMFIAFLVLGGVGAAVFYLYILPQCRREPAVMIGGDFINAPLAASPNYNTIVKYKDMTRVKLNIAKGRIVGAIVAAKGRAVCTGRIKDPGIVVRAIFERGPETVEWRQSWRPLRRLSREQVKELIEKASVPDVYSLLPPSQDYTQADDLSSWKERVPGMRGWLGRLLGGGRCETTTLVSPEIATPVTRYVNLLLYQMFREGAKTRVLRRSEPLPALTVESETITAPPLEDVLDRLKFMTGLDPRTRRTPIESTIRLTFGGTEPSAGVPHNVVCQFDDKSDTCCQIRLERASE